MRGEHSIKREMHWVVDAHAAAAQHILESQRTHDGERQNAMRIGDMRAVFDLFGKSPLYPKSKQGTGLLPQLVELLACPSGAHPLRRDELLLGRVFPGE